MMAPQRGVPFGSLLVLLASSWPRWVAASAPRAVDGQCQDPTAEATPSERVLLQIQTKDEARRAWTDGGAQRLPELVSMAYYINLDRSKDRRESMEEQLSTLKGRTGLPYRRVAAVEAAADPWVQKMLKDEHDPRLGMWGGRWPGSLSCYHNHLATWRLALVDSASSSASYALVLEDDALIDPDALNTLPSRLAEVPEDGNIVLLGFWGATRSKDKVGSGCYRASAPFAEKVNGTDASQMFYGGMHAYLLRLSSLPELVRYFERAPHGFAPDGGTVFDAEGGCRKYGLKPALVNLKADLRANSERDDEDAEFGKAK